MECLNRELPKTLATVDFVEDGLPVKDARVTIYQCGVAVELVTDVRGHAETPLISGAVVDVAVEGRGAIRTIRVPEDVDTFALITYPRLQ